MGYLYNILQSNFEYLCSRGQSLGAREFNIDTDAAALKDVSCPKSRHV